MTAGVVVWLTGLPASGKSKLAEAVRARLIAANRSCAVLDGDAVRAAIVPSFGYTEESRDHFYETLARLAALLAHQELVVLVPATAHRRAFRDRARALSPRFIEVFVDVSQQECARRDPKGLYERARAGSGEDLPGIGVSYEPPPAPDVIAQGGLDADAAHELVRLIEAISLRPD